MKTHDEGYYKALGARIAELRAAKGMSQQKLADALEISQRTVGHYEVGRIRLQVSGLQALADALGVSVAVLLGPLGKPAKPARKRKVTPKKQSG